MFWIAVNTRLGILTPVYWMFILIRFELMNNVKKIKGRVPLWWGPYEWFNGRSFHSSSLSPSPLSFFFGNALVSCCVRQWKWGEERVWLLLRVSFILHFYLSFSSIFSLPLSSPMPYSCSVPLSECYGHLTFSPSSLPSSSSSSPSLPPQGVDLIHLFQNEVTIGRADCTVYVSFFLLFFPDSKKTNFIDMYCHLVLYFLPRI